MKEEIFRMERVTYISGGNTQLEDFNLQLYKGEIMGLNPINGHGLLGFLQLLQINLPLYDGYVYYCGEKINSWKRAGKTPNRIGVIEARSRLVERMTVSDNIFVLRQGFKQEVIQDTLLRQQLKPFMEDIGVDIPGDIYVEKLSAFERVVVELLRSVTRGNRLIVLNEINTVINGEELRKLHQIIKHYSSKGFTFLYIGLHLEEIMEICDRVALFSNGRIQKVIQREEMQSEVVQSYTKEFDRMIRYHLENHRAQKQEKHPVLRLSHLSQGALQDFDIEIYDGECLVVQSLDDQLFQELVQILKGSRRQEGGQCLVDGKRASICGNRYFAVVAEEPTRTMLFEEMNYMDNLCMGLSQRIPNLWRSRRIRASIQQEYGEILGEEVFSLQIDELTEQQKYQLVYTRILLQKPKVVICIQPFKGADFPNRVYVWKMLEQLLDKGMTVIILAVNLADSLSLADRLIRVGGDGMVEEIRKEKFGTLSAATPWLKLYRDEDAD